MLLGESRFFPGVVYSADIIGRSPIVPRVSKSVVGPPGSIGSVYNFPESDGVTTRTHVVNLGARGCAYRGDDGQWQEVGPGKTIDLPEITIKANSSTYEIRYNLQL